MIQNKLAKPYFWSALFFAVVAVLIFLGTVAWAWTNPSAVPPGGAGALSIDGSSNVTVKGTAAGDVYIASTGGRVGIGTTTLSSLLTLRSALAGLIVSVRNTANTANMLTISDKGELRSIDPNVATQNRVWGQGRPGVGVSGTYTASGGECIVGSVIVGRSKGSADWGGAAAACPVGWWVCNSSERGNGICATNLETGHDAKKAGSDCGGADANTCRFWLANSSADGTTGNINVKGKAIGLSPQSDYGTGGRKCLTSEASISDIEVCKVQAVWCCTQ